MKRRVIQFLLFLFFFLCSLWLAKTLLRFAAILAENSGSREFVLWVRGEPFSFGLAAGFLAGLIPLEYLFISMAALQPRLSDWLRQLSLEKFKPRVLIPGILFSAIVILQWSMRWMHFYRQSTSVFGSHFVSAQDFSGVFFSMDCFTGDLPNQFFWSGLEGCLAHRLFLWLAAVTLGYWIAALVSKQIASPSSPASSEGSEPPAPLAEEITMEQKTDSQ